METPSFGPEEGLLSQTFEDELFHSALEGPAKTPVVDASNKMDEAEADGEASLLETAS